MMYYILYGILVVAVVSNAGADDFCSWYKKDLKCQKNEFLCLNGERCIRREFYCNDEDDCGDNSDEKYCRINRCPENFLQCDYNKCIPDEWRCNGYRDCRNEDDENNCWGRDLSLVKKQTPASIGQSRNAINHVKQWISNQKNELNSGEIWGPNVDRLTLTLYLADDDPTFKDFFPNKSEMAYELSIQLLTRLLSTKLSDISLTDLASYVNAFLVTCINPRNFHGLDIIQELRNRVNQENYTNPYVLLALCNAGETITESDKKKLIDTFESKQRNFWAGTQAIVIMALACANRQPKNEVDSEILRKMVLGFKQQQYRNGTVVDLSTTALVMQALISTNSKSDPDNFDEITAFQELLNNQQSDGAFGDSMTTLLVTPVLTCKSLVDINSNHCKYGSPDENSALEYLSKRSGPKIRVQYSVWFGEKKDPERNLVLRVPQNMSLYGVMEKAAEVDTRFKFEYSVKNRKPYIIAISGLKDNPLSGEFWFMYLIQDGQPKLSNESPADIIPKDNDHYAMWYRKGVWLDSTSLN